jgi:hypothetical protein
MEESTSSLKSLNKKYNSQENSTLNQQLNNGANANLSFFNSRCRYLSEEIKRI